MMKQAVYLRGIAGFATRAESRLGVAERHSRVFFRKKKTANLAGFCSSRRFSMVE